MKFGPLKMYLTSLLNLGLITYYKTPTKTKIGRQVVIKFEESAFIRNSTVENTVEQLLQDLASDNYSIILCDGSLIQIQYTLEQNKIVSHRYCYIPLPVPIEDPGDIDNFTDQIKLSIDNHPVFLRSRIRFDYEQGQEDHIHPESHLTFNSQNCRIPVRGCLTVRRFFRFIFNNFVDQKLVKTNPSMFKPEKESSVALSDKWSDEIHVNWSTQVPRIQRL